MIFYCFCEIKIHKGISRKRNIPSASCKICENLAVTPEITIGYI